MIELRCNSCRSIFPETAAIDDEMCPECGGDSLFERTFLEPASNLIPVMCTVNGHLWSAYQRCCRCGNDRNNELGETRGWL